MMFRTAIALLVLSAPVFAQHGGHAGTSAGHSGFSRSPGFSRSFISPAPQFHYGSPSFRYNAPTARYGSVGRGGGFRGSVQPHYLGSRIPYNTNSHMAYNGSGRAPYRRSGAGGNWDHGQFNRRRHDSNNWYNYNNYPYGLVYGYPYVIDPGFYDWDDDSSDNEQPSYIQGGYGPDQSGYAYDQGSYGYDQDSAAPGYPFPNSYQSLGSPMLQPSYPGPAAGYGAPNQQGALAPTAVPTSLSNQPLTVIFKNGRSPIKMQNYMLTADVLTDLDPQQYEQIPVDQIDVAATQWANHANGGSFQIPGAVTRN